MALRAKRRTHLGYVPVQLIQYSNIHHIENSLRVYLALKYRSDNGTARFDKELVNEYSNWLEIHPRTFSNHIEKLSEWKWISMDKRNTVFIRSYKRLEALVGIRFRKRVELHIEYLTKDTFKAFLMGAVIGYFVWLQLAPKLFTGSKIRGSKHVRSTPHPLSFRYIAKITNLSHQQISDRIKQAQKQKFISREKKLEEINAKSKDLPMLIKMHEPGEPFPVQIKGKVFLRHPDHYSSQLHLKRFRAKKK